MFKMSAKRRERHAPAVFHETCMKKEKFFNLLIISLFLISVTLILYPFAANLYNGMVQSRLVTSYEESISGISETDYAQYIEAAQAWNEELYAYVEPSYFPEDIADTDIYESLLNINGDGMMGYVVIPKIDVTLPIYHYTSEEVLQKGAGHLSASALPVGGESTHCVITAHRGLPTAQMFTDLDRMETGDVFYLKVLGETLAYEVIRIQEVSPDETQSLLPAAGEDLCTLVTCTPYGINSRRLLVTGSRTAYAGEKETLSDVSAAEKTWARYWYLPVAAAAEIVIFLFIKRRETE